MEGWSFMCADSCHPLLRASLMEEEILEPQGNSLLRALLKRKEVVEQQGDRASTKGKEIVEQQGDSLLRESLKGKAGKEIVEQQGSSGEIIEAGDDSDVEFPTDACCRICLERHNNTEGNALISPCMCKGTQQFVHRSCLNQWRSIKEGFAFSHCTTCKAQYHIRVELTETYCWRKLKFQFFVARDIFLIFLILQIIISAIGSLAYLMDKDGNFRIFFNNGWIHGLSEHPIPFYYCLGVLVFLVIFGVFGVIMHCVALHNGLKLSKTDDIIDHYPSYQQYSDVPVLVNAPVIDASFSRDECASHEESTYIDVSPICCSWCCCCNFCAGNDNPRVTKKRSSYSTNNYGSYGSDCNCNGCDCICIGSDCNCRGSSNDNSAECLGIFLIVFIVIFAILGILYGIFAATIISQRIWQRHYHILIKRELTKEYVVEDLHGNYSAPHLDTEHENRLKFLKLL